MSVCSSGGLGSGLEGNNAGFQQPVRLRQVSRAHEFMGWRSARMGYTKARPMPLQTLALFDCAAQTHVFVEAFVRAECG